MPPPISFWDRPDVNRFLPAIQDLDDEPDAGEFVNHSQERFDGAPPPRFSPQTPLEPMPLQGPDLVAALSDFIARRGKRMQPPVRNAYLPYLGRVLQGTFDPSASLQASAVEGR